MRDFTAGAPGRLRILPVGAKILYSAFVVATLVGLLLSARLYSAAVGESGSAVYYAGAVATAQPAASAQPSGGPAIDVAPEDLPKRTMDMQMPERKLLEVTHFHLFSIPIYVLVLAHLWLLAKVPVWAQNGGVVAAVVTSALHIAAPWIVRGRPALAFLMGSSGAAMLIALGGIALGAMIDMWLPSPKPPAGMSMAEKLAEMRKKNPPAQT